MWRIRVRFLVWGISTLDLSTRSLKGLDLCDEDDGSDCSIHPSISLSWEVPSTTQLFQNGFDMHRQADRQTDCGLPFLLSQHGWSDFFSSGVFQKGAGNYLLCMFLSFSLVLEYY